jgi:CheY-like chemotaxis protein
MAHTGPTALAAALDYRPDVILLDIGLPEWDGYEVAKRIRQEPALRDTVLVAITGYEREADRQRSQQAGFDHHLVKPADFERCERSWQPPQRRRLDDSDACKRNGNLWRRHRKCFGFSWSMTTETVRTHWGCCLRNSATKCM